MSRTTASLVIISYNGRHYLEDCLDSVLAECWPGCQLILVDNASQDGSPEWIQASYPDIQLVCNPHNLGFAAACNQGAALACGDVLVFLNQDTRVAPGWLGALLAGLEHHPQVALATSKVLLMSDPHRIHLCGQDMHYTGLVFGRAFNQPQSSCAQVEQVSAVSGASSGFWPILLTIFSMIAGLT